MGKLWRRAYCFLYRRRLERELADEMEAHREMMEPDRRAHFGDAARLREQSRDAWSWSWLEQLLQDLAYGARVLRRAPGFTAGAVAVLALGLGVNLAELQIFDAVIFHRLHFRDANAFLEFSHVSRERQSLGFPPAAVEFYRTQSRSFAWLVCEEYREVVVEGDVGLRSDLVSGDYSTTSESFQPGDVCSNRTMPSQARLRLRCSATRIGRLIGAPTNTLWAGWFA